MSAFDFAELTPQERYKMLCAAVIPRPVAWITSCDKAGVVNAAPYSFFNVFAEEPPLVIVGIDQRTDGRRKDTIDNVEATGEFTVNLADTALVEKMVETSALFPPGVSEPEMVGLDLLPGARVATPRLAAAPIALECRVFELKPLGKRYLLMGEVVGLVAREGLFDPETKRLNVEHYDPVARLYAASYARLGPSYDVPVPDWRTMMPETT
ncbi:MAG: flavin reductase family protein [Acuticoccus sp.]